MSVSQPVGRGWSWARRRPLVTGYLLLLLASHFYRWAHPIRLPLGPDQRAVTLHAVRGTRLLRDTVRLAFQDLGPRDGPAVLLIHGSPGDGQSFAGVAPALATMRRVINVDLPGFGQSTWDVPDYSILAHAGYLVQLLDSLRIRRVDVVGFSMGGGVALQLADSVPERVRSLTLLASIGAQEFELLGDYQLNHAIHALQLAGLWLLREATPHFGRLDGGFLTVEYARNFYDTDQRPLRAILRRLAMPVLILHGEHDPLVTPAAAREHHRLVPQSELRMELGDHFAVFMRPEVVIRPLQEFLAKVDAGRGVDRAHADPDRVRQAAAPFDPHEIPPLSDLALVVVLGLLAASTLLSEDLACITAGLMVARGTLSFGPAALACFLGIYLGDLMLFFAGRWFGAPLVRTIPLRWFLSPEDVERSSQWFTRKGAALVFITRFLPGTRLPTYFAAGMLRARVLPFAFWFLIACLLWTPALVGIATVYGEATLSLLHGLEQRFWLYLLSAGLVLLVVVKLVIPLCSWRGRRLLLGSWRRKARWEYWPRWAFYPPVVLYVAWLALRHRSLLIFTAVNPAIPAGGFVGESKSAILRGLDGQERVARFEVIPAGLDPAARLAQATGFRERLGLEWPVVLKPDVGERGSGVAIIRSEDQARSYLELARGDTIVQEYAPGFEFGVFYYRLPGEPTGRIFSVTEKRFPAVTGDGVRTLEELILADDRAVAMAPFYLRLHASHLDAVPAAGSPIQLVELGTHCRGAAFYDGAWVRTPALEQAIDRLSQPYEGFWFGRYDVRTPSVEAFQQGESFKVVELNGATSEATHIYDPRNSLGTAYRTLFAQWRLLYAIAARNVELGARPATFRQLWQLATDHHRAIRSHRNA